MWNEFSASVEDSAYHTNDFKRGPLPAEVISVEQGSIAEDLGFEPGDKLIRINGEKPRDLIDYKLLINEEELHLEIIDETGKLHMVNLEKEADEDLGLEFSEALFDGLRQCNNKCPFCFIDQQPAGKRTTLYLKDDDYRLSFLYGSYLTLTNLNEKDWKRIAEQRLSPLYVSVHSTNPKLRSKLLKNPKANQLIQQLHWFNERNLQIHAQVVVCPGLNDGLALEKTLQDLACFGQGEWPAVLSAAVVPVGLTRFRPKNDGLKPVDEITAKSVIHQIEAMQKEFQLSIGSRFAWLSDEWYLIAGELLPPRNEYENLPQQENGVGSIRAFLEEMNSATSSLPDAIRTQKSFSWVVGKLVKEALNPICKRLNSIQGLDLALYGLPSPYWGQDQVVTGLLTGEDLIKGLKDVNLGDELLIPSVMLKEGTTVFLDDMTIEQISNALQISIRIVHGAADIVAALIGDCDESP